MIYYMAFNELSTSRQMGMGLGYIPYREISSYLDENEIFHPDERTRFRRFITFLDNIYVKKNNEKSEAKSKSNTQNRKK